MASGGRVISDGAGRFRSWELPEVGGAGKAKAGGGGNRPRPPTAGDIEQLEKQVREEAFRQGHAEGEAQGRQEGLRRAEQRNADVTKRLKALLDGMSQPYAELDERVVETLVELAVSVARHIIRRELRTDPEQVIAVVREAVAALPEVTPRVEIHLHPEDAALVRETVGVGDGESAWTVVEKPMITRGGCRVASESSQVDATIERRVAEAVAHIMGEERGRQGGGIEA
ncbi:MAG: flagellar assembly protein FliH [Gammaproteobacteria bacterium]|nr:flagellar assembly protein FliH [Gammaproteobacteria bacterium]